MRHMQKDQAIVEPQKLPVRESIFAHYEAPL